MLIRKAASARFRAMFRLLVIFISIVWASLLLISWGGATPVPEAAILVEAPDARP